jgi:pSer/pThr/pTyr-binding forkhead associated (FHA) protein
MPKFCRNGHQIEDSWDICPYCQRTGFQTSGSASLAKTRLDVDSTPSDETSSQTSRRTVLINEPRRLPVVGWLVAMNGEHKGEDFRLHAGQNMIGAATDCQITLRDTTVTGRHASLRYQDGKFTLTDLDSTNGTYLNESPDRIAREELKDNDTIRIGEVVMKFKCL